MKKLKIGFGEGGAKGFLARHVEKCVLIAVILLMAYFIYSGSGTTSLEGNLTQTNMKETAAKAQQHIDQQTWAQVVAERLPKIQPHVMVEQQSVEVEPRKFAMPNWDPQLVPRLKPRQDPVLYAPERLIVTALVGPLVIKGEETGAGSAEELLEESDDPLLKYDVTLSGGGSGGSSMSGYPGGATSSGPPNISNAGPPNISGPSGGRGGKQRRPKGAEAPQEYPGTYPGTSPKGKKGKKGDDTYGAMPTGPTSGMGGAAKARAISPEAFVGVAATPGSKLMPVTAMVINATVPYEKQWNAFRDAFREAPGGQDPARDIPQYIMMYVQRADVTEDANAKWVHLSYGKLDTFEREYGADVAELSEQEALDAKLTFRVPPILLTDLMSAIVHPDVTRATAMTNELLEDEEEETGPLIGEDGLELPEEMLEGGYGSGSEMSRMPRGYGRSGSLSGASSRLPKSNNPRAGTGGGMGGSRPPSIGGAGGVYGGGGNVDMENYKPVRKKHVRFVDYDVQPGRQYRYRIQLLLTDPNYPPETMPRPEMTSLDDKARERVKAVQTRDEKAKATRATSWVMSPWSEASDPVSVPSTEKFFAGETTRPGAIRINDVEINTTEPQAKVLTVQWDGKLGVFAPAEQTVQRGGVLNTTTDVEVLHPVLRDLRKIPDYPVETNGVVLDMFGGDNLPSNDKEPQKAPGETLILDADGNLRVTDEAQDIEGYRRYIFPAPKETLGTTTAAGSSPDIGAAMVPPGYGSDGPPNISGPGPGRKGKAPKGR